VLTRDDIASVHSIFVLDEAKSIHELDLGDLAGAMAGEMGLNVGLGSCRQESGRAAINGRGRQGGWIHPSSGLGEEEGELTIPRQVAQVEARRRHLGHGCDKWASGRPAGARNEEG
jgi:hypothetical protein